MNPDGLQSPFTHTLSFDIFQQQNIEMNSKKVRQMATPRSQTVTSVATEKSPFEAILPPQLSVCVVAISTKQAATYKKGRATHWCDTNGTVA